MRRRREYAFAERDDEHREAWALAIGVLLGALAGALAGVVLGWSVGRR